MSLPPWLRELRDEKASPALEVSFAKSASLLAPTLSTESFEFLKAVYEDPHRIPNVRPEPIPQLIADAGLLHSGVSVESAKALLAHATEEHRDPFLAIAAQMLEYGETDDQVRAVEILRDLAARAQFAEAAVQLAVSREHLPMPDEERARWREYAASLWAPSVRSLGRQVTRITWFGAYYTAHLLAARFDPTTR